MKRRDLTERPIRQIDLSREALMDMDGDFSRIIMWLQRLVKVVKYDPW